MGMAAENCREYIAMAEHYSKEALSALKQLRLETVELAELNDSLSDTVASLECELAAPMDVDLTSILEVLSRCHRSEYSKDDLEELGAAYRSYMKAVNNTIL